MFVRKTLEPVKESRGTLGAVVLDGSGSGLANGDKMEKCSECVDGESQVDDTTSSIYEEVQPPR